MMWVQHLCGNRENEFFSFLSKIAEYPDLETLVRSLNSRNNIKLTNFFEEIAHYQNPDNYSEVLYLGENNQQIELISEQLSSRLPSSELIEQVPIKSIYQKSFILCRVELGYYLNELIKKLNLLVGVPIAILISNDIHTIGIKWDSISGLWSNSDINLIGDDNYLKPTYNTPEITELIFDSLFDTEGEYAGFTINIVMNKMDYAQNSELSNFFTSFVVTLPDYAVQSQRKNARKIDLLYIAVSTLCLDDVNNLLSHGGVNPNSLNNSGLSPLNIACIKGAFKLVQALIAHPDIDPNIRDADGYSPLDVACGNGDAAIVSELLAHKFIAINEWSPLKQTPLHVACRIKSIATIKRLLTHPEIDPNVVDEDGYSPLDVACGNGDAAIVSELLAHKFIAINVWSPLKQTPLHAACQIKSIATVKRLLTHPEIDPNVVDGDGYSPLYLACGNGDAAIVSELLTHKYIAINVWSPLKQTPLHAACQINSIATAKRLLTHTEIDPNAVDGGGYSPLDVACLDGNVAMVNELLTHKSIDINKCNPIDQTPLHTACALNNTAIVNVLLSHKDILPHKRNNEGISPLDLAFGNTEIRYAIQAYDLRTIQKAVDTAQKKYSQWYNGANHRGENGFFSWLRHGSTGQRNAFLMNQTVSNSMRYDEAKLIINKFLIDESKTRYHRHSFASFLLDELNQIEDSPWTNVTCDSGLKLYNKRDVIIKLSPFVNDYEVEQETFFI
ncbi:ankyrin repeat domain-containing protein [uncultured Legionella sp.]|uniref:ankyrin repeat domain-containing protein n=1 Tax=uncultured Legionella sp. TaxID=210934 RepID=UPI00261962CC|nr:ankyrin repeat domain-containing protein [uncultured Legionella sp.]